MEDYQVRADLLIVGGGSAGCMAANRALELQPDLKVAIFEKGDIKYSGSIARGMDALNIVAIPDFTTPELYVEAITLSCAGVVDQAPSWEMANRSFSLLKKLEGWGVYFPKDEKGNYRTLQYHPKGKFLAAMEEPNLKVLISQKALEKGAKVFNRVMGLQLLIDEDRVAGAVGIHVRTGELITCQAKAVILAAGGTARFSLPNSGYLYGTFDYPGNTGDGYVMAFKAGARLTGMEYCQRTMLIKDANIPLLAITLTRGGRLLDIYDQVIMEGQCHDLEAMERAFREGKGPLRIRLSHLKPELIEEIEHILFTTERPIQERFFKGRGINFRHQDIELWPTECQLCGGHGMAGIVVNKKAETSIPGLYAAGDVACVPRQHLTGAFVFGEVAAEQAVNYISSIKHHLQIDDRQIIKIQKERNSRFNTAGKDIDVRDWEYKVRRLIGDYVISPKNEYKLLRWLEWAERLRHEGFTQVATSNGHELSKSFEIDHIIQCASFSARAALERKESRWGMAHYRTDYPQRDDQNWLRHIVIYRGDGPNEIKVVTQPVQKIETEGASK